MKKCSGCKKIMDEQFFIKNDKEYRMCNECREYQSLWKQNYRQKNPEEYKKYRTEYNGKNIDKLKQYDTNRMLNRPEYFLFSSARSRARKSKLDFTITEVDIKNLLDKISFCPLRELKFDRGKNRKASPNSVSIDRIDSLKGYTKDNIQIISYKANLIKNAIDLQTFDKIVNNLDYIFQEKHDIDDTTRAIIIEDRLRQFKEESWSEKDKYRLLNVEKWMINSAKKRAKKSKLEININANYIRSIWPLDNKCPILEEKFVSGKNVISKNSATIDRIDNSKGYVMGNIMIVSALVNSVKNNAKIEELKIILKNWKKTEENRSKK
jgi:hypothetical protein